MLTLVMLCCCGTEVPNDDESHIDDGESDSNFTPLNRPKMTDQKRQKVKVYGRRTTATSSNAAAVAFFSDSDSCAILSSSSSSSSSSCGLIMPPARRPLYDITESLGNIQLDPDNRKGTDDEDTDESNGRTDLKLVETRQESTISTRVTRSTTTPSTTATARPAIKSLRTAQPEANPGTATASHLEWLRPLIEAYEKNGRQKMTVQKWEEVLDNDCQLVKIAESSFAEVYKVTNDNGVSILKLMALRPPNGPGSQRETAVCVESVISEMIIMDMMADIPGFLEFKDAHVIEGRLPKSICQAYELHATEQGSYFPKPGLYQKGQMFLALELGNAGTDIEHFEIDTVAQIWDIILGISFALAQGEAEFQFEHRDLHEGNVCVKQVRRPSTSLSTSHKFGYSGLEVTLLDYTLSRAKNGEIIYRDLESDPEIFQGTFDVVQNQMYHRMRNWTFYRSYGTSPPSFAGQSGTPPHGSWEDFMPFTNVIWLHYVLDYIQSKFTGHPKDLEKFRLETAGFRKKIHPDTRNFKEGFESAMDVLSYAVEQRWITEDDIENQGMLESFSMLSTP